ncbi:glycoside hydrolase family 127 protein, partial [Bacillus sp. S34]|nr:glycoside hydrolase family 127 protein [Bacillus sp. S34]
ADEMERGLYNALAVSTAVDGKSFFYSNPLQLRTGHDHEEDAPSSRLDWYACACCPPNLARLLASIGGYVLTTSDDATQFHLYAA